MKTLWSVIAGRQHQHHRQGPTASLRVRRPAGQRRRGTGSMGSSRTSTRKVGVSLHFGFMSKNKLSQSLHRLIIQRLVSTCFQLVRIRVGSASVCQQPARHAPLFLLHSPELTLDQHFVVPTAVLSSSRLRPPPALNHCWQCLHKGNLRKS